MKIMSKIQVWGGDAEGSTLETQKKVSTAAHKNTQLTEAHSSPINAWS
jgi:hypothetical protein